MKQSVSNEWLGICGLREIDWDKREGEFGIIVHPKYWRQGYSLEAHLELLTYSFETLGL